MRPQGVLYDSAYLSRAMLDLPASKVSAEGRIRGTFSANSTIQPIAFG